VTVAKRSKTVLRRRPKPSGPTSAAAKDAAPLRRYIESSALVAAVLEGDGPARAAIRVPSQRVTSALTITEARRAVLRARIGGRITTPQERAALRTIQRFAQRCHIVSVAEMILARAGRPFPIEPVRTLDAIHLATAEFLGDPPALVAVVTRDTRIRENAAALGFSVE
jgi:predicted nucleic acid-binding protein